MDDVFLRERLDRLLSLIEQSSDIDLRNQVARLIDILPAKSTAFHRDLLVLEKPRLKRLLGRHDHLSKNKAMAEYASHRKREDAFGQICDLMYQIIEGQEAV